MNIAFIPARCGSKSIPWKNIKNFCGKPLIYWNLKALEESENIDTVYVATDCIEIETVVKNFNFSKVVMFERSKKNARDESSTEAIILEFLANSKLNDQDNFLLVQATSPLTKSADFVGALEQYQKNDADSLLSCVRSKRFFWDDNCNPINYDYRKRPRRQEFDGLLMENGAFYISTVGRIKKSKNRLNGKISTYIMDQYTSVEIDEEEDWAIAENLMRKHVLNDKLHARIKLFLSDVDGTMTDSGMYYDETGNEIKKFNTRDGKGFELLRRSGIKTGVITSENTSIVANRAQKLKIDFLHQGLEHGQKLHAAMSICRSEGITLEQVAYIGDDINCIELLSKVGYAACPNDAEDSVKQIPGIKVLGKKGGYGAVREFVNILLNI